MRILSTILPKTSWSGVFRGASGLGKSPPEEKHIVPSSRARPDSQGTQPGGQKKVTLRSCRARPDSHGTQSGGILKSSCRVDCALHECSAASLGAIEPSNMLSTPTSIFKFGTDSSKEVREALINHCSDVSCQSSDLANEFDKIEWALDHLPESVSQDLRRSCANVYESRVRVPWRKRSSPDGEMSALFFFKEASRAGVRPHPQANNHNHNISQIVKGKDHQM